MHARGECEIPGQPMESLCPRRSKTKEALSQTERRLKAEAESLCP